MQHLTPYACPCLIWALSYTCFRVVLVICKLDHAVSMTRTHLGRYLAFEMALIIAYDWAWFKCEWAQGTHVRFLLAKCSALRTPYPVKSNQPQAFLFNAVTGSSSIWAKLQSTVIGCSFCSSVYKTYTRLDNQVTQTVAWWENYNRLLQFFQQHQYNKSQEEKRFHEA